MSKKVNPKHQAVAEKIVEKGKVTGKDLVEIGYSKGTAIKPTQVVNSKGVQRALEPLLKQYGITREQYLMNLGEAMRAEKQNQFTGEINIDHTTRLSANKAAEKFLGFEQVEPDNPLKRVIKDGDEVELQRIVFRGAVQSKEK